MGKWDKELLLRLMNRSFGSCLVQNTLRGSKLSHLDSAKEGVYVKPESLPGVTVLSLHRIRTARFHPLPLSTDTHLPILVQDVFDVRMALGATVR